jgi:hypothetical protein
MNIKRTIIYIIIFFIVFIVLYLFYKCAPNGEEYLKLWFNATSFAGAAAILGLFYERGKDKENTTEIKPVISNSKGEYPLVEDKIKGIVPSNTVLLNQIEHFKYFVKETTKNKDISINLEDDFIEQILYSIEEPFSIRENEFIKDGFERVSLRILYEFELKHEGKYFFTPERFLNPIQSCNYIFDDKSAENKIIMKFYTPKKDIPLLKTTSPSTQSNIPLAGYIIFGMYYNTKINVMGFRIGQRDANFRYTNDQIVNIEKKIKELR